MCYCERVDDRRRLTSFFLFSRMEAFVARHVLIKLLFDGDVDGDTTDPNTGEMLKAPKTLFFLNRRQFWTIVIYLATLVPALLVDDLGPVLSFTGAIGGCSLAYIAPGLAYLGAHGDAVLAWFAEMTGDRNHAANNASGDLPVAGDASASLQLAATLSAPEGVKPWWWVPLLMPIWVNLARTGSSGMNERLTNLGLSHVLLSSAEGLNGEECVSFLTREEVVPFRKRDAYFSIFFIVFGVIALVAGILSNVYVQVNGVFQSQ